MANSKNQKKPVKDIKISKKEYYLRGKKVTVDEITNILALKLEIKPKKKLSEIAKKYGKLVKIETEEKETAALVMGEKEVNAYTKAGWVFVHPSPEVFRSARDKEIPSGATYVGRVYRNSYGRIFIGTNLLTVKLQPNILENEVKSILENANLEIVRKLRFAKNLYEVEVKSNEDPLDLSVKLHEDPAFIFAEPELIEHIPHRFTPTDPDYNQQWHWDNDGTTGGTAGADVSAEAAWDRTRGAGVRIAIIDNGFDINHPDIAASVGTGAGFFAAAIPSPNLVLGTTNFPDDNHGTECAGMAIARANNNEGGCGIANQATFIPIACLVDQLGTQTTLARAIAYAADPSQEVTNPQFAGADIISCSLGPALGPGNPTWNMTAALQNAIDFAVNNGRGGLGAPIFWASDNGNVAIDGPIITDEVVAYQNTIAVGRTDINDRNTAGGGSAFGPELDFVAPGVNVYTTTSRATVASGYTTETGTSFATPCCAGIAALINAITPNLRWDQIRQVMHDTCDKVGGVNYGNNGHHDRYGFGRVNAAVALCEANWAALGVQPVELLTHNLNFIDIPENVSTGRAIVFSIRSCRELTFEIVDGPTVLTGPPDTSFTPLETIVVVEAVTTAPTPREARIWIIYTGTNDGDTASGRVRIRCNETDEEWEITITANTVSKPKVASVLTLDKSGSMGWASGIPDQIRMEVLKYSAPIFVNHLDEEDAIGIVSFSADANTEMTVTPAGPNFSIPRGDALTAINGLVPETTTAIGDGLETSHNILQSVAGYDSKAIVVFTDGHETAEKYISDVQHMINERVFAIGLGTAEIVQPAALTTLTNGTGGYIVMVDELGTDDYLRLMKYFLQILASVTNADIVLDPEGCLKPDQEIRVPFKLTEADYRCDVILITLAPYAFKFFLETPDGNVIDPGIAASKPEVLFTTHNTEAFYQIPLPLKEIGADAGTWYIVLKVNDAFFNKYLDARADEVERDSELFKNVLTHGIRYNLNVHAHSNLNMRAILSQNSYEPGAELTLRAILTQYGIPLEGRANVRAKLECPDDTHTILKLTEVEPGVFETKYNTIMSGVYKFQINAYGTTLKGVPFTRERYVTGAVWKGGDNPPPSSKDDQKETMCKLLYCILNEKNFSRELDEKLLKFGINLEGIRKCIIQYCQREISKPTITTDELYKKLKEVLEPRELNQLKKLISKTTVKK